MTALAPTLQAYFTDRLLCQRRASPNTVASYRDTFRLLLGFAQQQTGTRAGTPGARAISTRPRSARSSTTSRHDRGNSARTRNIRLAAVHSFFHYAALRRPEHAALIQRVLAIPAEALRRAHRLRSSPRRGRLRCSTPRSHDLGRPTRPRAAAHRRADRAARVRADRAHLRRRRTSAPARTCARRQRTQGARHPAHPPDRRGAPRLAARAPRPARRPALPQPRRRAAQRATRSNDLLAKHVATAAAPARRCAPSASRRTCCATPPR